MKEQQFNVEDLLKGYKLICDVYGSIPNMNFDYEYNMRETAPKLKEVIDKINLSEEELKSLDDYYSNRIKKDYRVLSVLNKIRRSDYISSIKDDNKIYFSFTRSGVPLFVDCLGKLITSEECSNYINEVYNTFNDVEFKKVNINSSKEDIKLFLKEVVNYVVNNKINRDHYDFHHLGFIHSYFIYKGWTCIYKSMEIFLRNYYSDNYITNWYLDYNIKRKDKESIKYKILFNNDELVHYDEDNIAKYKRLKLAKRYYKEYVNYVLLAKEVHRNTYIYAYSLDDDTYKTLF